MTFQNEDYILCIDLLVKSVIWKMTECMLGCSSTPPFFLMWLNIEEKNPIIKVAKWCSGRTLWWCYKVTLVEIYQGSISILTADAAWWYMIVDSGYWFYISSKICQGFLQNILSLMLGIFFYFCFVLYLIY